MSLLEQQLQKALPKEDLDAVKSSYDSVASLLARNCRYLHENLADFVPQQKEKNQGTKRQALIAGIWEAESSKLGKNPEMK